MLLLASGGKTKNALGDQAFVVAVPRIRNGLTLEVRNEANINQFKQLLKA